MVFFLNFTVALLRKTRSHSHDVLRYSFYSYYPYYSRSLLDSCYSRKSLRPTLLVTRVIILLRCNPSITLALPPLRINKILEKRAIAGK